MKLKKFIKKSVKKVLLEALATPDMGREIIAQATEEAKNQFEKLPPLDLTPEKPPTDNEVEKATREFKQAKQRLKQDREKKQADQKRENQDKYKRKEEEARRTIYKIEDNYEDRVRKIKATGDQYYKIKQNLTDARNEEVDKIKKDLASWKMAWGID